MPGPEDPLRKALEGLAAPADPAGAYERIVEKKVRRQIFRKLEIAALAVVVLAGTVGGTFVLTSAFRPDAGRQQAIGTGQMKLTGNGEIAFVSQEEGGGRIYAITPDGTHLTALTTHAAHGAAWSPDGSRLAFSSSAGGSIFDIFVMNADGSGLRNLTNSPTVIDEDPAWSPDGRQIAFVSNRSLSFQIWVMNADGSRPRRLSASLGKGVRHPAWSPDGRRIAFSARETASLGRGAIFVMNVDGSGLSQIYQESGCCVYDTLGPDSWSPDGKQIVFIRDRGQSGTELYAIKADGADPERLARGVASGSASWSPDGKQIVFIRDRGQSGTELYAIKADGADPERLARGVASGSASWSPDGRRIVFSRHDGLYVMDADGGHQAMVPDVPAGASSPVWRPARTSLPGPPSPTRAPTSPPTIPSPPPLGPDCDGSTVYADFNGDGMVDTATVARTSCLFDEVSYPYDTPYALDMRWGGGTAGSVPLPDCQAVCIALAAGDLNLDGAEEFILQVGRGASTQFVEVYELPAEERFGQHAATIAEPGSPGYPGGQTAVFAQEGSVTHLDFVTCTTVEDGTLQIHATSYALNREQTEYAVRLTVFVFDVNNLDGEFVARSSTDSTFPFDRTGRTQPRPSGASCWEEGSSSSRTSVP